MTPQIIEILAVAILFVAMMLALAWVVGAPIIKRGEE